MSFAIRENRNNRVVYRRVDDLDDMTQQVIRTGFTYFMDGLKKRANKAILAKDKRGRVYIIRGPSGRSRRHISSAPGQSHANRRGTLRKSLSWKVHGWQLASFGYGVSTTRANKAPRHGKFVDRGTAKMEPRPSLQNAVDAEDMDPHFEAAFDRNSAF